MMRFLLALLMIFGASVAQAAAPHYVVRADFSPAGDLTADVTITLPETPAEKAFLLSKRFKLQPMQLPPGVGMRIESSEVPMPELAKYVFRFARPGADPVRLRFRYSGPINTEHDSGNKPMRAEGFELFIDHMWFPVGADIQTRFTLDASIEGLAPDLVVVAQGKVTRTPTGVRIARDYVDIDIPLVAMRGLQRAGAPGVEFYSRDLTTRLSRFYVKHAEAAAAYFQRWFGPLRQPVRMALVWRERSMGYARTGYTVVSEGGRGAPDLPESNPAGHMGHEVAHAWWMLASPLSEDFWLVESVAEYLSLRYVEVALGPAEVEKELVGMREAAAKAGPIMGHGRPDRVQLYQKGPLLLIDLERKIGRPAMDALLADMSREPVHTTPIFMKHLSAIAGAETARSFAAALRS